MKDLLKRGVGVHHGGLLPIIKEMVEILFSRGLIKVLFATETFAMGVNMPARTVVFSSLQKHDGQAFRELLPGEYTQMSGRAGRRGLDAVGTVIISCPHEIPEVPPHSSSFSLSVFCLCSLFFSNSLFVCLFPLQKRVLFDILLGQATRLESQFRLTYNMILNLLRVEDFQVEDMIKRSFSESHAQRKLPQQLALLKRAEEKLKELEKEDVECIFGEPDIESYHYYASQVTHLNEKINHFLLSSRTAAQSLVPGRVVMISSKSYPNSLSVILRIADTSRPSSSAPSLASNSLSASGGTVSALRKVSGKPNHLSRLVTLCFALSSCFTPLSSHLPQFLPKMFQGIVLLPTLDGNQGEWQRVIEFQLGDITAICKAKLNIDIQAVVERNDSVEITKAAQELIRLQESSPDGPPTLHPIRDLKVRCASCSSFCSTYSSSVPCFCFVVLSRLPFSTLD
jgi:antiviral helicase SKI2